MSLPIIQSIISPIHVSVVFQINQITHWLDSSNVYGSSDAVARSLRTFSNGLLNTARCSDGTECLPYAENNDCRGPTTRCALAGGDCYDGHTY